MSGTLYIDCLAVSASDNQGTPFTNINNFLSGEPPGISSTSTTQGYKWILQISCSGGNISASELSNYKLRLCTNYLELFTDPHQEIDFDVELGDLNKVIQTNGNIYVGWTNNFPDLSGDTMNKSSGNVYLADQLATSGNDGILLVTTRFFLMKRNDSSSPYNIIDMLGDSSTDQTNKTFKYSPVLDSLNLLTHSYWNSNNWSNRITSISDEYNSEHIFYYRRNKSSSPVQTVPSNTFITVNSSNPITATTNWTFSQLANGDYLTTNFAGDPHITTHDGKQYNFSYEGAFRLFESECKTLIINGYSSYSVKRWKDNQYITKILIKYKNKYALIDCGFRDNLAKIIHNNGLEISEEILSFDKEAQVYCYDCRKKYPYYEKDNILRHNCKYKHEIYNCVRNQLNMHLLWDNKEVDLTVSNVNKYNLQPCRLQIKSKNIDYNKCKGTIVDRKYVLTCKLDCLENFESIDEPDNYTVEDLPEFEKNSILINKQFA